MVKDTLKTKAEFKAARKGKYIVTDTFTLVLSKPLDAPKVAYVTSAKVGNAVQRNRLRRVAREVFVTINLTKTVTIVFKPGAGAHYAKGAGDLAADIKAVLG